MDLEPLVFPRLDLRDHCAGLVLGAFVRGFKVEGTQFVGGAFDWLSVFSLFCALALVAGYALLGACWLIMKTKAICQEWSYAAARRVLVLVVAATAVVSLWTPLLNPAIAERWFSWPNIALLSPVPLVTAALAIGLWTAIRNRREALPFLISMGLFLLAYAGLAISLWPNVVPPEVTLWEAASPPGHADLPVVWRCGVDSRHPRLYRLLLLCLPRQGPPGRGVSSVLRRVRRLSDASFTS